MSPAHEPEEQRRRQILAAAGRRVARAGYHQCTIDGIAREAGLSKGAVYWYFDSKERLLVELCRDLWQRDLAVLQELVDRPGTFADFALAMGAAYTAVLLQGSDDYRIHFELWAMCDESEEMSLVMRDSQRRLHAGLAARARRAIAEGELRADTDADALAVALAALFDGLTVRFAVDRGLDPGALWTAWTAALLRGVAG